MKTIKATVLTVILLAMSAPLFAQGKYGADSAECIKYLSYYKEYYKQKSYDEAVPSWREAYRLCPPQASYNLYVDGATLVRRLIAKNGRNVVYKQALVDTLFNLYDIRIANYPKYAVQSRNTKGMDIHNYIKDDNKRVYDELNAIIAANGAQTKGDIFVFDLAAAIELFKVGAIDAETVINVYQTNLSVLDGAKTVDETAKSNLEGLFISSKVASCEDLIALFSPRLEADPENIELVNNILKMMGVADDCVNNELYLRAATTKYRLDPSAGAAYALYRLNAAQGKTAEAIHFIEAAIASEETDKATDADYTYQLAAFCYKNGKSARAYELAKSVISLDEAGKWTGKTYFLIGQIWSNCTCQGDEIERRAPYWVAVDYFQKAKAADETLAEEANKFIANCSKYFPETAEAFMYNLTKGDSYTVKCGGMSAVTTVRTQN